MSERRKPTIAFYGLISIALPVLYVLSFGPVCWIANRCDSSGFVQKTVATAYRPLNWIANRSEFVATAARRYFDAGAREGTWITFEVDGILWWANYGPPGSMRPYYVGISPVIPEPEQSDGEEVAEEGDDGSRSEPDGPNDSER